jgi:uncharacterized coiled-coil protein SlyX
MMIELDSHLQPDAMEHPDDDTISQLSSMVTKLTATVETLEEQNKQFIATLHELQETIKSM